MNKPHLLSTVFSCAIILSPLQVFAVDLKAGDILVVDEDRQLVTHIDPVTGSQSTSVTATGQLSARNIVLFDNEGNIITVGSKNYTIKEVYKTNPFTGDSKAICCTLLPYRYPSGTIEAMALDNRGDLIVAGRRAEPYGGPTSPSTWYLVHYDMKTGEEEIISTRLQSGSNNDRLATTGLVVDKEGRIFVLFDMSEAGLIEVDPNTGSQKTLIDYQTIGLDGRNGMAIDQNGDLVVLSNVGILKVSPTTGQILQTMNFGGTDIAVDKDGQYILTYPHNGWSYSSSSGVARYDPIGNTFTTISSSSDSGDFSDVAIVPNLPVFIPGTFSDIPRAFWAFSYIETLADSGITSGCGNGNYCPNDPVTRAQMAVFLERGMRGSDFIPGPGIGNIFLDVPASYWAGGWIELLFIDGITSGCGSNNYCPGDSTNRAQMAVFLLRAKYGQDYSPPTPVGVFNDIPLTNQYAGWIEQLAAEGITGGCGNGNYCPNAPVTRAQMAVFLVRTFGL